MPGVKVEGCSRSGGQLESGPEKEQGLKKGVMGTASKGGGGVRQGSGRRLETPSVCDAGDGWGGQREGVRTWGRPEVMLGSQVCAEMRPHFCGCVISLLQAGNTAAEPHRRSARGLSSGHQSLV